MGKKYKNILCPHSFNFHPNKVSSWDFGSIDMSFLHAPSSEFCNGDTVCSIVESIETNIVSNG